VKEVSLCFGAHLFQRRAAATAGAAARAGRRSDSGKHTHVIEIFDFEGFDLQLL
jgi:hypothetical protein